jgi:hypothetical protein
MMTRFRAIILGAVFAMASIGAAHADGLRPTEGRTIDLGELSGVAYYTVERDGFRVVATLAEGEAGTPVRVEAMLAEGQSIVLSVPRAVGVLPHAVEISRQGDELLVRDAVTN